MKVPAAEFFSGDKYQSAFVWVFPLLLFFVVFPPPVALSDSWGLNGHPEYTLLLLGAVFCLPALVIFRFCRKTGIVSEALAFGTGASMIMNDRLFYYNLGEITGTALRKSMVTELQFNGGLEVVLTVLVLFASIVVWLKFRKLGQAFCRVFFFVAIFISLFQVIDHLMSRENHKDGPLSEFPDDGLNSELSPVILVILDRLDTRSILSRIQKDPEFREAFRGFDFFPHTFSTYKWTELSIPSLLTGEELPEGRPLRKWLNSPNPSHLGYILKRKGYRNYFVGQFAPEYFGPYWDFVHSGLVDGELEIDQWTSTELFYQLIATVHMIDFMILKSFPGPVQSLWDEHRRGPMGRLMGLASWGQLVGRVDRLQLKRIQWMKQKIEILPEGGFFLLYYTNITHHPFFLTKDCQPQPNIFFDSQDEIKHRNHIDCALTQFKLLLEELREASYFRNSVVAVISDHGHYGQRERAVMAIKGSGVVGDPGGVRLQKSTASLMDVKNLILNHLESKGSVDYSKIIPEREQHLFFNYEDGFWDVVPKRTEILTFGYDDPEWNEELKSLGVEF